MPPTILAWKDIDRKSIVFEEPRQNSHHGLTVPIKYVDTQGNRHPICFQTPIMRLPFGISDRKGEYGRKIEANFSFHGYAPRVEVDANDGLQVTPDFTDKEMAEFYKWIAMWDKINVESAVDNGEIWFKKKISREVVQELYKPNIKPSSQPDKYSPTVRAKIPTAKTEGEEPAADFFTIDKDKQQLTEITRGSKVIALVKVTGLWFAGKSFGMNYTITQMVTWNDKFEGCAILLPPGLCGKREGGALEDNSTKRVRIEIPSTA